MADSLVIKSRLLFLEDFAINASLAQIIATVLGIGDIPLTPFFAGPNDAAAIAAGLQTGDIYLCTGLFPIRLRCIGGGGSGGSGIQKLSGTLPSIGETVMDGIVMSLTSSATVQGVLVGDGILVGSSVALPTGVTAIGKVPSNGSVTVEIWNISGGPVTLPAITFTVAAFH